MSDCPHSRIEFCPLYVAAHEAGGNGCDDGRLGEGGCAVSRGMDYGRQLASLSAANRALVLDCAERENEVVERIGQILRSIKPSLSNPEAEALARAAIAAMPSPVVTVGMVTAALAAVGEHDDPRCLELAPHRRPENERDARASGEGDRGGIIPG